MLTHPPDIYQELENDEMYLGWCQLGTTGTDEAKWVICHVSAKVAGVQTTKWADGTRTDFRFVWDDRATYDYKFLL